jgi:hypothetical protein
MMIMAAVVLEASQVLVRVIVLLFSAVNALLAST